MIEPAAPGRPTSIDGPVHARWLSPRYIAALAVAVAAALSAVLVVAGPMFVALVGAGAIALIVTVHYPGILLAAYLLVPFYKGAVQPYSPLDITVVLAVLCFLQIVPLMRSGILLRAPRRLIVLWTLMAMTVLGGVLYAPDQEIGLFQAITFISLITVPLVLAAMRVGASERHVRHLVWTYALMGIITVLVGLIAPTEGERLELMGTNTFQTARAALLVPLILVSVIPAVSNLPMRLAAVAFGATAVLVALSTGSRGPIVALLLLGAIAVVRLLTRPQSVNIRLVSATAVFTVLAIAMIVSGAIDIPRAATFRFEVLGEFIAQSVSGDSPVADTSTSARLRLYSAASMMLEANPLLGAGTGGFQVESPEILWPADGDEYPHNAILQLGAEHGVVGIAIFIGLTVLALTRPVPAGSYGHIVRVLFLFFLLNAMFSESIHETRQVWGLMVLLALMDLPPPAREVSEAPTYVAPALTWHPQWAIRQEDWYPSARAVAQTPSEPGPYALPPPPHEVGRWRAIQTRQ